MSARRVMILVAVAAGIVILITLATSQIVMRASNSSQISVDEAGALSVRADITVPYGDLTLTGGSETVLSGDVPYPLPEVSYAVADQEGQLVIQPPAQAANTRLPDAPASVLSLNNDMPLDLTLARQQGASTLNLTPLSLGTFSGALGDGADRIGMIEIQPILTEFHLQTNAGDDVVAIDCDCPSLLDASLDLGAGADRLSLHGQFPTLTSLSVEGGSGDDTLAISGEFPGSVSNAILLGSGDDRLSLSGAFNPAANLIVNIGTGDDVVTLGDSWPSDATITVISEGDSTALELPANIGVRIEIASRSNEVIADGLTLQDGAYVNEAYGQSPVTLRININTTPNETIRLTVRG